VSGDHPETSITVLAAMPTDEIGSALIRIEGDGIGVRDAMERQEGITSLSVLREADDEALIQFDTTEPMVLLAASEAGLPIEPPVRIRNGEATLDVTAPHDRLSALGERLESFGMDYTVEHVYNAFDPETMLTDRQRRVLRSAVERGYYDTPRTCTLTDLAREIDVAKSTLSEVLHRAEGTVLKRVMASPTDLAAIETPTGSEHRSR
jgi:predicted DNA binding protein